MCCSNIIVICSHTAFIKVYDDCAPKGTILGTKLSLKCTQNNDAVTNSNTNTPHVHITDSVVPVAVRVVVVRRTSGSPTG